MSKEHRSLKEIWFFEFVTSIYWPFKKLETEVVRIIWSWLAESDGVPRVSLSLCSEGNLGHSQTQARSSSDRNIPTEWNKIIALEPNLTTSRGSTTRMVFHVEYLIIKLS